MGCSLSLEKYGVFYESLTLEQCNDMLSKCKPIAGNCNKTTERPYYQLKSSKMTAELCFQACLNHGFKYAGLNRG